jgi:hypothetical protein
MPGSGVPIVSVADPSNVEAILSDTAADVAAVVTDPLIFVTTGSMSIVDAEADWTDWAETVIVNPVAVANVEVELGFVSRAVVFVATDGADGNPVACGRLVCIAVCDVVAVATVPVPVPGD